VRPTLGGKPRLLEVHLFGFAGDLYGRNLEVQFATFLRAEMKLPSLEALRRQIARDAHAARMALAVPPA
jgi:riboflavin kinase/FMN adenylyltransferase